LFYEPKQVKDLAEKIQQLWDDATKANALAEAGYQFASDKCTEKSVVNYFNNYLNHLQS
jgi:hypothetical protein